MTTSAEKDATHICSHGTCESRATRNYHVMGRAISTGPFTWGSGSVVEPKTLHLCDEHALADLGVVLSTRPIPPAETEGDQ